MHIYTLTCTCVNTRTLHTDRETHMEDGMAGVEVHQNKCSRSESEQGPLNLPLPHGPQQSKPRASGPSVYIGTSDGAQGWARTRARDGISQTSVPFLPLPPGQALSLSCSAWGEAPRASHLGLGWASASWLPRLTWSWVAASSELSELGRWGCREWVTGEAPPPTHRSSQAHFIFPFFLK